MVKPKNLHYQFKVKMIDEIRIEVHREIENIISFDVYQHVSYLFYNNSYVGFYRAVKYKIKEELGIDEK